MAFEFIQAALAARRKDNLFRQVTTLDSALGALIEVDGQHYLNSLNGNQNICANPLLSCRAG